jgi:hypothetical protein
MISCIEWLTSKSYIHLMSKERPPKGAGIVLCQVNITCR